MFRRRSASKPLRCTADSDACRKTDQPSAPTAVTVTANESHCSEGTIDRRAAAVPTMTRAAARVTLVANIGALMLTPPRTVRRLFPIPRRPAGAPLLWNDERAHPGCRWRTGSVTVRAVRIAGSEGFAGRGDPPARPQPGRRGAARATSLARLAADESGRHGQRLHRDLPR